MSSSTARDRASLQGRLHYELSRQAYRCRLTGRTLEPGTAVLLDGSPSPRHIVMVIDAAAWDAMDIFVLYVTGWAGARVLDGRHPSRFFIIDGTDGDEEATRVQPAALRL